MTGLRLLPRLWVMLGALCAGSLASPAQAASLLSASIAGGSDAPVLILGFDGDAPPATSFALAGPRRLVIDVKGAVNRADASAGLGVVSGVRAAQFDPGTARVVVDLGSPAVFGTATVDGRRLSVPLVAADASAFSRAVAAGRQQLFRRSEPFSVADLMETAPRRDPGFRPPPAAPEPVESAAAASPAASSAAAAPRARSIPQKRTYTGRPVVVIDAGHGGHDPGSRSANGINEKTVTLAISKAIADEINAAGRFRAVLTRDDDTYLRHRDRTEVARRLNAQLFISVHADSFPKNPDVSGATIYTLSETASDKEAARLAARENQVAGVDLREEDDEVTSILIDLAQRETMNASAEFAAILQREMVSAGVPFRSHFHRFAGFLVLKAPDVPAILLETGYMSNAEDAKYLTSERGKKQIAAGVNRAVEAHFLRRLAQLR